MNKASPYALLKWNTRRTYDQVLDTIQKAFGKRVLAAIGLSDFRRWYDEAKKPNLPDGPERIRKAHGIISIFRRLVRYGVAAELPECARLFSILDQSRFKQPKRRRSRLELCHVEAIVDRALVVGRLSIALGTAIQFETGMRQRDVIGEWAPLVSGGVQSGIIFHNRRWQNGLTWGDLGSDRVIQKETTKTGAIVSHDLRLSPLVMRLLDLTSGKFGPLIIDEAAGRPYAAHAYTREWRVIARSAGVPDSIWNMDARAGAITEAEDAGAELDAIRGAVGHTQASTTARYSRGAIGKSRKVAELRIAHRAAKNVP